MVSKVLTLPTCVRIAWAPRIPAIGEAIEYAEAQAQSIPPMAWFKGFFVKTLLKPHMSLENRWFPDVSGVDFLLNQVIDIP